MTCLACNEVRSLTFHGQEELRKLKLQLIVCPFFLVLLLILGGIAVDGLGPLFDVVAVL